MVSLLLPACGSPKRAQLFFVANDGVHGNELWSTDGTGAGTAMVKDIDPINTGQGEREYLTNVNGTLFLAADDGVHGAELWSSDGTEAGTRLVRDILPGSAGSRPFYLRNVGGMLFFVADDGRHGLELWRSDGTAEGTFMVRDIYPGATSSAPEGVTAIAEPTGTGTFEPRAHPMAIATATPKPQPLNLIGFGGAVFFSAFEPVHGRELWRSDGTAEGTTMVADILRGAGSSWPAVFSVANGQLMFSANTNVYGRELWRSDGEAAGTRLVKDLYPGSRPEEIDPPAVGPLDLTEAGQILFFTADFRSSLWRSDGTAEGTFMLREGRATNLVDLKGELFFMADDGPMRRQGLWRSDGTIRGTRQVSETGGCGSTALEGVLLFVRPCTARPDIAIWRSDRTAEGTLRVRGGLAEVRLPLRTLDRGVLFAAGDPEHGVELWRTDGTEAGTGLLKDIRPGPGYSNPRSFTVVQP